MVYIDDMNHPYGRMVMCHMIADSTEELLQMADAIGVKRKWIQEAGTYQEHFDVSKGAKAKALKLGAKTVTQRELIKITMSRKDSPFKDMVKNFDVYPAPEAARKKFEELTGMKHLSLVIPKDHEKEA